jgi:hypothetical protein
MIYFYKLKKGERHFSFSTIILEVGKYIKDVFQNLSLN